MIDSLFTVVANEMMLLLKNADKKIQVSTLLNHYTKFFFL